MLVYNLLSTIALITYVPWLLFKKGPENKMTFISERLGMSDYTYTDIWIHAVSVGEVLASLPFLKNLKKEFPGKRLVLSTTTYTGQKIARERFPEADRIMYMPLDTGLCIRRAVNLLRPKIFITVETELWPMLFHSLKKADSLIIILNGRISNDSFTGYKKIKFFMKKVLENVDYLYMQGKSDAEKIISLGAAENKVGVMGNFKFDIEFDSAAPLNWLENIKGNILLAASTHKGEEEIILDAYDLIKKNIHDLKLILAPRHPERFDEVAGILNKRGLSYIKRSEIKQLSDTTDVERRITDDGRRTTDNEFPDIILLDSMGELSRVFSKITIALIGGSLVPLGGHNILEPAFWSKPILFGPHMDNFPIAEEFLERSAALRVESSKDISETVIELLIDNEKALNMGVNARAIIDKNTGAVKKAIETVRGFVGTV